MFSTQRDSLQSKQQAGTPPDLSTFPRASRLFELLLGAELVGVSALALTAVGSARGETRVALAANHLVAVELGGKRLERWFNHLDSISDRWAARSWVW